MQKLKLWIPLRTVDQGHPGNVVLDGEMARQHLQSKVGARVTENSLSTLLSGGLLVPVLLVAPFILQLP